MPHVRKQLRDAIVTAVTGLASTGSRVRTDSAYAEDVSNGASLTIVFLDENASVSTVHPSAIIEREMFVAIDGRAKNNPTIADTLDVIAEQVETALGGQVMVGSIAVPLEYQGTSISFSGESDQVIGLISLRYRAVLFTAANAPGTLVNG